MFKNKSITKKMVVIVLSVLILANATGIQFGFANEYEEAVAEYVETPDNCHFLFSLSDNNGERLEGHVRYFTFHDSADNVVRALNDISGQGVDGRYVFVMPVCDLTVTIAVPGFVTLAFNPIPSTEGTGWNMIHLELLGDDDNQDEISIADIDYIIFDFTFHSGMDEYWVPGPPIEGLTVSIFNTFTREEISPVNTPGISDVNGNLQVIIPALPGVQRLTTYETAPGRDFSSRTLDFYPSFPVGSSVSTDDEGNTFLTVTVIGILNPIPGDYTPDGDDNQDTGNDTPDNDNNQENENETPDNNNNQDNGNESPDGDDSQITDDNNQNNEGNDESGNDDEDDRPLLPQTGINSLNVAAFGVISAKIGLVTAIIKNKKKTA